MTYWVLQESLLPSATVLLFFLLKACLRVDDEADVPVLAERSKDGACGRDCRLVRFVWDTLADFPHTCSRKAKEHFA